MTISFVSSGPGNPDLLTVLAVKRISDADIIFYDDLSAGEILNLAKKRRPHFVVWERKRGVGHHQTTKYNVI